MNPIGDTVTFSDISTLIFNNVSNATGKTSFTKPSPLLSALTFTLGVVGNIVAIVALFRSSKRHKWSVFYRLITALAITDLFGILTVSPVVFAFYDNDLKWVGGQPLCHYMSFMLIFAGLATVLLVGAMSLDRFLAIMHPFQYNTSERYRIVHIVISAIWIFSITVSCLPLLGLGENVKQFPGSWCFFNFFGNRFEDRFLSYFYASIGLGTIIMTAILNSCVIAGLISGRRSHARRGSISSSKSRSRTDIYIAVFLVAIFAVFAVCWAPFLIRIIINQSKAYPKDIKADLLTLRLATLNQILDPWVYILFRREMLAKVTRFLQKQKQGTFFRRLASLTGSVRASTTATDFSSHGTNGTPTPHRRQLIKSGVYLPKESSKDESQIHFPMIHSYDKYGDDGLRDSHEKDDDDGLCDSHDKDVDDSLCDSHDKDVDDAFSDTHDNDGDDSLCDSHEKDIDDGLCVSHDKDDDDCLCYSHDKDVDDSLSDSHDT